MDFKTVKSLFESLYTGVNGYQISSQARKKLSYASKAHTYGEVTPECMASILKDLGGKNEGNFYDLGSGTGKVIILAAMLGNFSKVTGIEIIKELHQASVDIFHRFESQILPTFEQGKPKPKVELVNEDFLNFDFSDADVIFSHSTCFYDELMFELERKLAHLKSGTKIMLVTKTLVTPMFKLLKTGEYPMTWGKATVNFYEKV